MNVAAEKISTIDAPSNQQATPFESATSKLDSAIHTMGAVMGLSPIALSLAWLDWGMHLASSPGRQMELGVAALKKAQSFVAELPEKIPPQENSIDGAKFVLGQWDRVMQAWREWGADACKVQGVSPHHMQMNQFFMGQIFELMASKNWPATNPDIWQATLESGGRNLWQGEQNWLRDRRRIHSPEDPTPYRPGHEVAITPGQVVYRNHLIELICYTPQTATVHPEPLLIVPSWIMKYYILDLSPHNSMVKYLVQQGHQVFILSWNNPDAADRDLGMEDYLQLGVFDALAAIKEICGEVAVHSAGYCLGGTLLAIAASALARPEKVSKAKRLPSLASVTLLAAQTDFAEPGEMGVLIDDSQVNMIEDLMAQTGYMTGAQMAGSFQFLNSRDLVWNKRLREYWLGVRDAGTDMMAWNADVTRLPARMHGEYLHQFFLENALAEGKYLVEGKPVSLQDIRQPMFVVGTARDQVSPWRSVYKILRLARTDICFLLASGGHNAGIVSEPGHAKRSYQMHHHHLQDASISADSWPQQMATQEGSWWPAWQQWLAARSSPQAKVKPLAAKYQLQAAPGSYVLKKFDE
ncbi:MAG: polyhydroxyalkanoic acid synthase [Burkholderiales bacterium]|nr:polyhydroxyalkanoic acid synthase [Burkholderiales bacterium]